MLAKYPNVSQLAPCLDLLLVLIKVILLGICCFFLRLCLPGRDTPIRQGQVIPQVAQGIVVPVTE